MSCDKNGQFPLLNIQKLKHGKNGKNVILKDRKILHHMNEGDIQDTEKQDVCKYSKKITLLSKEKLIR